MAARHQFLGPSLRAGGYLYITCPCGRETAMPAAMAIRLFGYNAQPPALRKRLVCSACGRKGLVGLRT